ncbi:MAG: DNA recombination protein RmuC [Clostridia bacterium]|nr:DNA recombination protein RmuC [Clostridia bacterium]
MDTVLLIICAVMLLVCTVLLIVLLAKKNDSAAGEAIELLRRETEERERAARAELNENLRASMSMMNENLSNRLAETDKSMMSKLELLNQNQYTASMKLENRIGTFSTENEQKLENIRATVEKRLNYIQEDNNKRLDEVRKIVDEKLQERMTQSFALVTERLEQVYKGLGEMQTLAVGVGDLKKVLSNVKTRGVLGEMQLGAIISEILAPEQYETNVVTVSNSRNPVEYAVKMPGGDGMSHVYLPIDAKFPSDAYYELMDAYDSGDAVRIKTAQDNLKMRIKGFAKDIKEKYISPPNTTDFAIMFLPTEGLYAEAVKLGLIETLQREYKVNMTGPSTMAAFLNSLQMGFRTLAIQKRSSEVWKVLGAVRTEFDKFQSVLEKAQDRIVKANNELDLLIGVRTRQIRSKLKNVTELPQEEAELYLPLNDESSIDI